MQDSGNNATSTCILSTLLILVMLNSLVPPDLAISTQMGTTTTTGTTSAFVETPITLPLRIDRILFMATVPSYAEVGRNYTVKVRVENNWDQPVPIVLRVDAPVNSISVHPLVIHTVVGAGSTLLLNFSLIPFSQPSSGRINVTAVLAVWFYQTMNRPQVVDQVSTSVQSISPSHYVVEVILSMASVAAVTAVFSVLLVRRTRRGSKGTARDAAPPTR